MLIIRIVKAMRRALIQVYTVFLWMLDSLFIFFKKETRNKPPLVLLIRLDNIGDFILWISSIKGIRKRYADHDLILLANKNFAELAKDIGYFSRVISIDTRKFAYNPVYRWKVLAKTASLNVKVAINPSYSRNFLIGDSLMRASVANTRVGSKGDLSNITVWQKEISDQWYTHLIFASNKPLMELERDAEFLSGLGVNSKVIHTPQLPILTKLTGELSINEEYFIVFPGASWAGRKWPLKSFAKVGREISQCYRYKMVVCGTQSECQDAELIIDKSLVNEGVNLAGKTTLSQFCELVRGAKLLIGNETSAVHIAAATNTPSICLLGGGHFGRFMPYSGKVRGVKPVAIFSKMDCYGCNWKCIQPHRNSKAMPCISDIKVNDVLREIDMLFINSKIS